jgi:hypothetical protein
MMLSKRRTTNILLLINLALVLFIAIRAGSVDFEPAARATEPLTIRILDQSSPAWPDTLVLNDFEKTNDVMNMYDQGGEYSLLMSSDHVTHLNSSLMIDKVRESNIELATIHFPRQWNGYSALELDIYNDSDENGTLWVRVGSQYDARRFYPKSQKYARAFIISPGSNTVSIPVRDIAKAFGSLPKRKSIHLNIPANGGRQFYLDFLRLVRHDGTDE